MSPAGKKIVAATRLYCPSASLPYDMPMNKTGSRPVAVPSM
jgi:hypothetical protein